MYKLGAVGFGFKRLGEKNIGQAVLVYIRHRACIAHRKQPFGNMAHLRVVRSKISPCAPVKPLWLEGICTSLKPMSWLFANGWLALYAPMPAAPMMAMAKAA